MKKKYKIIGETEKTVTFIYGGTECCYAKSCYSSIEEVIKEIDEERKQETIYLFIVSPYVGGSL